MPSIFDLADEGLESPKSAKDDAFRELSRAIDTTF